MTTIERDKLNEIIDVELSGGDRKPELVEIAKKNIDRLLVVPEMKGGFQIIEALEPGSPRIPISDGTNMRYLEWGAKISLREGEGEGKEIISGEEKTAKQAVIEYFDKLNEGKEYKLYVNEPPRTISEHMRRTEGGELVPRFRRENDKE